MKVVSVTVENGGTGYNGSSPLVFTGGGGTGAKAKVGAVNGVIQANQTSVGDGGSGYTSAPTVTVDGPGSGAVITAVIG